MEDNQALSPYVDLATYGHYANQKTRENALNKYQQMLAQETRDRQVFDIATFETFLASKGIQAQGLLDDIQQWRGITHGIVEEFNAWQLLQGYATGSINVRLATIKAYCRVAGMSGVIPNETELRLIQSVKGYKKQGRNVDEARRKVGLATRMEHSKKANPIELSLEQVARLKKQPDTPAGRRDSLLLCLLLDLGLRCSEIGGLTIDTLILTPVPGLLKFYRHKVDLNQTFALTKDIQIATERYLATLPTTARNNSKGPLFYGYQSQTIRRHEPDYTRHLTRQSIYNRVSTLGRQLLGIENLSPHDCRHTLMSWLMRNKGINLKDAQALGGWSKPDMVLNYALSSEIPNERMEYPRGWAIYEEEVR